MNEKLRRVRMQPMDWNSNGLGIAYRVDAERTKANGLRYRVQVRYADKAGNEIVSDPRNCVDLRVYQTSNAYDVDFSRKYVQSEGGVAEWPRWSRSLKEGQESIVFYVAHEELESRGCARFGW